MALRLAVNNELTVLENFLTTLPDILLPGGRCCILSFHSLEDRIVKEQFRRWERGCRCPLSVEGCFCHGEPIFQRLFKKVLRPQEAEVARNPLSRSACLRAAQRL